eukprot:1146419-Pelagomonas_calceolata.AAC.5
MSLRCVYRAVCVFVRSCGVASPFTFSLSFELFGFQHGHVVCLCGRVVASSSTFSLSSELFGIQPGHVVCLCGRVVAQSFTSANHQMAKSDLFGSHTRHIGCRNSKQGRAYFHHTPQRKQDSAFSSHTPHHKQDSA